MSTEKQGETSSRPSRVEKFTPGLTGWSSGVCQKGDKKDMTHDEEYENFVGSCPQLSEACEYGDHFHCANAACDCFCHGNESESDE